MRALTTPLFASLVAASLAAQQPDALIFTTASNELTACPKPAALEEIEPQDVMSVVPSLVPPCAEKFAPHNAFLTLAGDEDGDSQIWEAVLSGAIDALVWDPDAAGATDAHGNGGNPDDPDGGQGGPGAGVIGGSDLRGLFFSPKHDIDDCVNASGTPTVFTDGDVARIVADGQFSFLIREEQIKSAFGIPNADEINVDAVALDRDQLILYLSLEEAHTIDTTNAGTVVAEDGAILAIPLLAYGEPVTVAAASGLLVAHEVQVDNYVSNSNVRDRSNMAPAGIGDTDGLHVIGGTWANQWGQWNHLMFCGENLTGGAVLSTRPNGAGTTGSIMQLNGIPLANNASPTTGGRVGLRTAFPNAGSLNGLECRKAWSVCNFVLETSTPQQAPGGAFDIQIGGAMPGAALLLAHFRFDTACYVHPILAPWANPCFPEIIQFQIPVGPVPIGAAGFGVQTLAVPAGAAALDLTLQAVTFDGVQFHFSTPMTLEVL